MIEFLQPLTLSPYGEIFSVMLGLLWGSFFNVCIYRIPEEQDIVFTPSRCPACKKNIPWFCNIPVISYLFLRGKCFHCKKAISIQYPLVEAVTAVLFLWLYFEFGWSKEWLCFSIFHSALLIISVIDIHHQIIPDELSLGGMVVGFCFSFWLDHITWSESLIGILLGGGAFYAVATIYEKITKREGLGGGDVKLLGMIGAWLGYQSILPVIIISSALGSVIGAVVMLVQKGDLKTAIPFGPFLAVAAFIYAFWGREINLFLFPPI